MTENATVFVEQPVLDAMSSDVSTPELAQAQRRFSPPMWVPAMLLFASGTVTGHVTTPFQLRGLDVPTAQTIDLSNAQRPVRSISLAEARKRAIDSLLRAEMRRARAADAEANFYGGPIDEA